MNALTQHFDLLDLTADQRVDAMNALQANGVISDNCSLPEDVWTEDAKRAVAWLVEKS